MTYRYTKKRLFIEQEGSMYKHIEQIVQLASQNQYLSDIHIAANKKVSVRINGDIMQVHDQDAIDEQSMKQLVMQLLDHDEKRFHEYHEKKELDFSYLSEGGLAFRVNAYFSMGDMCVVMRKINKEARNLEDMMFSDMADAIKENILTQKKGLYIVTGPTGSGKSTSLVAMLQHINQHRTENIITIEDPVEFIFEPDKCLISQREVGNDTKSFTNALKYAMREDPDIVFVGEIRDRETAEAVLKITESGHIVFTTLHTPSAALTINRFISFFPPDIQQSIGDRLSEVLLGVQAQILVKTKDQKQRIGVYEIMFNTTSVRNNIRERDIPQINSIIETSSSRGMVSMSKYAERLHQQGIIDDSTRERIGQKKLGAL